MRFANPLFITVLAGLAMTPTLGEAETVVVQPTSSPDQVVVTDPLDARMFASGLTAFGIAYGASVVVAATSDRPSNERLYVPVLGPWLALADRDGDCDEILNVNCDDETTAKVLLVVDGVFQGAGLLAMVNGVLNPTQRLMPRALASRNINIKPSAAGSPGLTVMGKF